MEWRWWHQHCCVGQGESFQPCESFCEDVMPVWLSGGWHLWKKKPHLSLTLNSSVMTQQIKVGKGKVPKAFRGSGPGADFRPLFSAGRAPPLPRDWMQFDMFSIGPSPFFCTPEYISKWLLSQEGCWFSLSLACCLLPVGHHSVVWNKCKRYWPPNICGYGCDNFTSNPPPLPIKITNPFSKCLMSPVEPFVIKHI